MEVLVAELVDSGWERRDDAVLQHLLDLQRDLVAAVVSAVLRLLATAPIARERLVEEEVDLTRTDLREEVQLVVDERV